MASLKKLGLENTATTPYQMGQVSSYPKYTGPVRASHTTEGGMGGLGTKVNGGYSYIPNRSPGLSQRGFGQGLLDSYNSYMNPEAMSGATYQGDYGSPVELTYGQLDAINNPTRGSEATGGGLSSFGGMDYVNTGLQAVNAYGAYQQAKLAKEQLGLAKEQFGFEKAATNRNLANMASQYNTGLQNSGEVGMALAGNTMTSADRAARQAQLDSQKLSTAAIG